MQVQGVYLGEESFHSLHALWQLPREFKAIKVSYGQIGKGHPNRDRRVPFDFNGTRRVVLLCLKAEDCRDIQLFQLSKVVIIHRGRSDKQARQNATEVHGINKGYRKLAKLR
jgi:hypothetical protein